MIAGIRHVGTDPSGTCRISAFATSLSRPSIWGHDRMWLTPELRQEAREMRLANGERGLRRPVRVLPGNHEIMAGACPWFDAMKKQQKSA
jgi:hypothetical protein